MKTLYRAALAAALAPAALADSTVVAPTGFNVETNPLLAGTIELEDGSRLLVTGSFLSQGLGLVQPDGTVTPFATGFGSVSGVAQSPVSGLIVVGDSNSGGPDSLFVLEDLNGDGDALDAGEKLPHPVQPPVLSNGAAPLPFDILFAPGTDAFYMSGSTPFGVEPSQGVVTLTEAGAVSIYADGLGFPGALVLDGETLLCADVDSTTFTGGVASLRDLDGDGNALGVGENVAFATGFAGAGGFVGADDGSFYLATGFGGSVDRLAADGDDDGVSDAVQPGFLQGFGFAGSLGLAEGDDGFVPGGEGELRVSDFTVGSVAVRAAPPASTSVDGLVANNSQFDVIVDGAPGAAAVFILSLDPAGITLPGIGDLCLGFGAPFVVSPFVPMDGGGEARVTVGLLNVPGLVGMDLAIQGFAFDDGRWGVGNGLLETIQ